MHQQLTTFFIPTPNFGLSFVQELMEENNDLRELLQQTESELVNLLNKEHRDVITESGVDLFQIVLYRFNSF
jgi:hypothetical protein